MGIQFGLIPWLNAGTISLLEKFEILVIFLCKAWRKRSLCDLWMWGLFYHNNYKSDKVWETAEAFSIGFTSKHVLISKVKEEIDTLYVF